MAGSNVPSGVCFVYLDAVSGVVVVVVVVLAFVVENVLQKHPKVKMISLIWQILR